MEIGEGFVGSGANAAHINTILGERAGPVGSAWATALATPSTGHAAFVVVGQPGIAVLPATLFVNKATISGDQHARMTWGPAQAGVAQGVGRAVKDGVIAADVAHYLVLIAAVWVDPAADDAEAVFANNAEATERALRRGHEQLPSLRDAEMAALHPWNPFFRQQN
jgi:5,6,7,8-tetrahydromethanopterin hydro-lyase